MADQAFIDPKSGQAIFVPMAAAEEAALRAGLVTAPDARATARATALAAVQAAAPGNPAVQALARYLGVPGV